MSNQPSNFKPKNQVEINDDWRGTYGSNSQIKFKASMLAQSICGYSDAYVLVSRTITIAEAGDDPAARQAKKRNKEVIFKKLRTSH